MAETWLRSTVRYVVHGFRVLRRRPALFASAAVVLGVTAGAMLSLAGLVDRLLLRPLPIAHPERLVQVLRPAAPGSFDWAHLPGDLIGRMRAGVRRLSTVLTIGYAVDEFVSYSPNGFQPEAIRLHPVDVAAFDILGVRPRIGRLFGERGRAAGFRTGCHPQP